jgi:hypothetical protein
MYLKMTYQQFLEWYHNPTSTIKESVFQADKASQLLMELVDDCRSQILSEPDIEKASSGFSFTQIDEMLCRVLGSIDKITAESFLAAILSDEKIFNIVINRLSDFVDDSTKNATYSVANVEEILQLIPTLKDRQDQSIKKTKSAFNQNFGKWLLGIAATLLFVFLSVQAFDFYKEYVIGTPSPQIIFYDFNKYSPISTQYLKNYSGVRGKTTSVKHNIAAVGALLLQCREQIKQNAFKEAFENLNGYRHFVVRIESNALRQFTDDLEAQHYREDAERFLQEYYFMFGISALYISLNSPDNSANSDKLLHSALEAFEYAITLKHLVGMQTGYREEYYAAVAADQLGDQQKAAKYRAMLLAKGVFFQTQQ